MAVRSVILPYSWFNVSVRNGNTTFDYYWVNGVGYTVTLTDGFYLVSDLNNALQLSLIANGLYLIDSNGDNVYYLEIVEDSNLYANQILQYIVPLSLPAGYTAPSNIAAGFYPTPTSIAPYLSITTTAFGSLLGFPIGTYPLTYPTASGSVTSTITPNLTPVNSIIMRCNLINNSTIMPSDIMDSFTFQDTTFGSNGVYEPKYQSKVGLKSGTYSSFVITFVDQNLNPIYMNDSNVLITLLYEEAD
jgi:hypothetical protein